MRKLLSLLAIAALLTLGAPVQLVRAATVTSASDVLSTVKQSTAANHTITFTTPSGVGSGGNFTLVFGAGFNLGSVAFGDVDITDNGSDLTLAGSPSGATWGVGVSSQTITVTSGNGTISAGHTIVVKIGTHTSTGGAGTHQITNPGTATSTLAIGGGFGDTGTIAFSFVSNDIVNITANVDPSITFTVSDNSIGFGTLDSTQAHYATGDAAGATGDSAAAHNLTIGTNAAGGFAVTYVGATLTSGGNTITAATVAGDADGSPGQEQFGMSITQTGASTIASGYDHAGPDWKFVAGATTTLISQTTPTATNTIGVRYLANIASTTEPGSYQTNLTFVASGTF